MKMCPATTGAYIRGVSISRDKRFFTHTQCTCCALVVPLHHHNLGGAVHLCPHHRHRDRVVVFGGVPPGRLGVKPRALAKVRQLGHDIFVNQYVVRLDVAVDEGLRKLVVQVRETFSGVDRKAVAHARPRACLSF